MQCWPPLLYVFVRRGLLVADTIHDSRTEAVGRSAKGYNRFISLAAVGVLLVGLGPWVFDTYLLNILIKAFFFAVVAVTVDVL